MLKPAWMVNMNSAWQQFPKIKIWNAIKFSYGAQVLKAESEEVWENVLFSLTSDTADLVSTNSECEYSENSSINSKINYLINCAKKF